LGIGTDARCRGGVLGRHVLVDRLDIGHGTEDEFRIFAT